jgi:5-amino-6-(5-phosphoribosylamino)uracil reductase
MAEQFTVERLWPDPESGLDLDEAFGHLALPAPPDDRRVLVATNMVTTIDGRAQRMGTAEGLSGRVDRRLMRLYRVGYDAVGSGIGTLRATDFWSTLPADLAERRAAVGRPPQPLSVVIAGSGPVPTDRRWFSWDQPRLLVVGAQSPLASGDAPTPADTDLLVAPTDYPAPEWVADQLADRGIGSLLLEGGPTTNAAYLAAGCLDELYWTVGARVLATEALPMLTPIRGGSPFADAPREATLVSAHRFESELFLRYRFEPASVHG